MLPWSYQVPGSRQLICSMQEDVATPMSLFWDSDMETA